MSAALFAFDMVRYALGLLLACAALGKGFTLAAFRENLYESFGVPTAAAKWLAPLIVLTEAILTAGTLAGVASARPALAAALLLFCVFTAVLVHRYLQEGVVRCACFGEPGRAVSPFDLLRNLLISAAMAAWLLWAPASDTAALQPLAAGLAVLCTILLIGLHDIASILRAQELAP